MTRDSKKVEIDPQLLNLIMMHCENLIKENTGLVRIFKRWAINDEPLRSDAKYILQRLKDLATEDNKKYRQETAREIARLKSSYLGRSPRA